MLDTFRWNVIFPVLIYIEVWFFVHITLMYEYLFYKNVVRRSIGHATKGKKKTPFSRRLFDIEYNSFLKPSMIGKFCPLVCWSGYKRHNLKKIVQYISRLLFEIEVWFLFLNIHLINEHLFCKYLARLYAG